MTYHAPPSASYTPPPIGTWVGALAGAARHAAQCAASPGDTQLVWVPGDFGDPTNGLPMGKITFPGHLAPQITPGTIFCVYMTHPRAFGTFGTRSRIRVAGHTIAEALRPRPSVTPRGLARPGTCVLLSGSRTMCHCRWSRCLRNCSRRRAPRRTRPRCWTVGCMGTLPHPTWFADGVVRLRILVAPGVRGRTLRRPCGAGPCAWPACLPCAKAVWASCVRH